MINYTLIYLLAGSIWTLWLEHYTINELDDPWNAPWTTKERFFHILIWPYSFGLFVYTFIKDFFENFK